jgi:hypothetical protein
MSAADQIDGCCFLFTIQEHTHVLGLLQTNTLHGYFIKYCPCVYDSLTQMNLISTCIRPTKHDICNGTTTRDNTGKTTEHLIVLNIAECRTSINCNSPYYSKPNAKHAEQNRLPGSYNLCLTTAWILQKNIQHSSSLATALSPLCPRRPPKKGRRMNGTCGRDKGKESCLQATTNAYFIFRTTLIFLFLLCKDLSRCIKWNVR